MLESPPTVRPRVLVVDDEMGPRESLRMLLKPRCEIKTAESAREALEELGGFAPDLVILDIKMPEMDGLEVLHRIKQADPAIEVVMITAYASLETVKLALSRGAFEYLIKPFSRKDLEDVVRRALARREANQGQRHELAAMIEDMRRLAAKTSDLEEAARREAAEQSLRVTQLSILREVARTFVGQLDFQQVTTAVTEHLRGALGYDSVTITLGPDPPGIAAMDTTIVCRMRDAGGHLGYLVVDNRRSGRRIDPREHELIEMLGEYLAIAIRNSLLYTEVATTKGRLEQLVASAGEGIVALGIDDLVTGWNPAAERIFGVGQAEAVGRPITAFLPGKAYAEARCQLEHGGAVPTFEVSTQEDEGRTLVVSATLSAVRGRNGEVQGFILIAHDITAQREVEQQLHQSEKLSALGQLAGGIAHDFNNLLQSIIGYTELMKQDLSSQGVVKRSLEVLEQAALDGAETVRRIQQFARLRPDEALMDVDVNRVVEDAVAITRPRWQEIVARENRPLTLDLDLRVVPPVSGRPAALTEVMTNLILNAIDAMPSGGRLSLATCTDGESVMLTVTDSGTGMPEAVRRRIFEPFFSTKGDRGSGLGLAMAYSIVKRHGGSIRVDSEVGHGTMFTITLPVGTRSPEADAPAPRARQRRAARLLLVDDHPEVLATMAEVLESLGHAVTTAADGRSALEAYLPGHFDVVITDIGMAGMTGWEFAERLRDVDRSVPLFFLTGWGIHESDRARLTALNVSQCLFKPVPPPEIDAVIQTALASL